MIGNLTELQLWLAVVVLFALLLGALYARVRWLLTRPLPRASREVA